MCMCANSAGQGWAAKDMLQLAKKMETYHPKGDGIDQSVHGHDGPVHISDGGYRGTSENQFLETVKLMGYKQHGDLQDFESNEGFAVSIKICCREDRPGLIKIEMVPICITRWQATRFRSSICSPTFTGWTAS